ncbi:MAG TPA: carboxypeptidase regulatory-like domain-containing protein [Polyangiaceae bacterium]|jgi:serine/threonine-protein kinase|nr:carboxypeptidase regulatory-like domain-containing protein [Polyangiaceae bacterium]
MGDERDTDHGGGASRGQALSSAMDSSVGGMLRSSELDVKGLWGDDDEPESSANLATVRASQALGGASPAPKSEPRTSVESAARGPLPTLLDLEAEAQRALTPDTTSPSALSPMAEALLQQAARRGLVAPGSPMHVPSLRPPSAAPPPPRASTLPPAPGDSAPAHPALGLGPMPAPAVPLFSSLQSETETLSHWPPTAQSAPRARDQLPELAPAPPTFAAPVHEHPLQTPTSDSDANPSFDLQGEQSSTLKPLIAQQLSGILLRAERERQPLTQPPAKPRSNLAWLLGGAALILLLTIAILVLRTPTAGTLVVTVSGPNSQALPNLRVYVDAQLRCSFSPCRIPGLSTGLHELHAEAPNYNDSAVTSIALESGADHSLNINLIPVVRYGKLSIAARGDGLSIFLDGRALGPPPQERNDVEPGTHLIRITGPRYEPLEQTVSISAGQELALGPLKPRVKLGQLTIRGGPGSEGASATLDGKALQALPVTVDVDATQVHLLEATKPGFDRFQTSITFPEGKAEAQVEIALLESTRTSDTVSSAAPEPGLAPAKLSANSIPASNVLVDGKPIGRTPILGASIAPGPHTVVFVHPERGKRSKGVKLAPGQSKMLSVRF